MKTVTVESIDGSVFHIPEDEYLKLRAVAEEVLREYRAELKDGEIKMEGEEDAEEIHSNEATA